MNLKEADLGKSAASTTMCCLIADKAFGVPLWRLELFCSLNRQKQQARKKSASQQMTPNFLSAIKEQTVCH